MCRRTYYAEPVFMDRLNSKMHIENDYTDKMVAERIGVDRKPVLSWRNGHSIPNAVHIKKLCGLFKCSADYLLGMEE